MSDTSLIDGLERTPQGDLVDGYDFYGPDPQTQLDAPDPISEAVGSPAYMTNFTVNECQRTFAGGEFMADPEVFDRYYFEPPIDGYDGPAPVLIDILRTDTDEDRAREREDRNVPFKTAWCAERDVRYVVLTELEDQFLPTTELRAKLSGEAAAPAPEKAEKPKGRAKAGLQKPTEE